MSIDGRPLSACLLASWRRRIRLEWFEVTGRQFVKKYRTWPPLQQTSFVAQRHDKRLVFAERNATIHILLGGYVLERYFAEYEIVTPMFMGGADQEATRIREASVKGALVFWWRALKYAANEKLEGNENQRLRAIQSEEQSLFGSQGNQSLVLLNVVQQSTKLEILKVGSLLTSDGRTVVGLGTRYLGYGLMEAFGSNEGKLTRSALRHQQSFRLEIIFNPRANGEQIAEVLNAVKILGLLGGLGARARRGWGSLSLKGLYRMDTSGTLEWSAPTTLAEYKVALLATIGSRTNADGFSFPLTAFAQGTQIRIGSISSDNPLHVLNSMGDGFLRYRGWQNGEKNFPQDHAWFDKGGNENRVPDRTAFGLPHNYSKNLGLTASNIGSQELDRRASPLLFHIHRLATANYIGVASLFPTRFLVTNQVAIWRGEQRRKTDVKYDFHISGLPIILGFLNGERPGGTSRSKPYFPSESLFE